jgi:hypothetical protein
MSKTVPGPDDDFKEFTRRTGIVLRGLGFRGSGQNFRRECGTQWQAINIQKSQWRGDRDDPIHFYVNVGFEFPELEFKRFFERPATIAKFIAHKADLRLRVDDLLLEDTFDWFIVRGPKGWDLDTFCAKFEKLLTVKLVPLLDTMVTPEGLADVLRTIPWMMSHGAEVFIGKDLAPPGWDSREKDAGLWSKDSRGRWWRQGER